MDEIEALMAEINKRHGADGMRAIATLMHDLGGDTLIKFEDGTYVPCDFIMQMAWANGGAPARPIDEVEGLRGALAEAVSIATGSGADFNWQTRERLRALQSLTHGQTPSDRPPHQ